MCRKLSRHILDLASEWRALDPNSALFSTDFYQRQILMPAAGAFERAADELDQVSSPNFPTGLVGLGVRSTFFFRLITERLAPTLAAGNTVLLRPFAGQLAVAQKLRALAFESGFPEGSIEILPDAIESSTMIFQHPGVKAVSWVDSQLNAELFPAGASWLEKKWQIHRGGKSTALVLADADMNEAAVGILRAIREGQGTASWNISRIIVVESIEKDFRECLLKHASQMSFSLNPEIQAARARWTEKLMREQARPIQVPSEVVFMENVSNCTEAHQVELEAPVVFLMSVKFPHEMQKWVANIGNAIGVQMWGSVDKIAKLALRLETARVWSNGWVETDTDLNYANKSSAFGQMSPRVFGGFHTEPRNLDGDPSKNPHWTE